MAKTEARPVLTHDASALSALKGALRLVCYSCAVAAYAALPATNGVPNPSFEDVTDGMPAGWRAAGQPKGFAWSVSDADKHSGKYSLCLRLTSHTGQNAHIEVASDVFPVESGKLQRLFGWYKSTGWSGKGNIYSQTRLSFLDANGAAVSGPEGSQLEIPYASSEAWKPVEMVVPAPAAARQARIIVVLHAYDPGKEQTPALFVDDLVLQSYDMPPVPPNARTWVYAARTYGVRVPKERVPGTQVGGCLHARAGQDAAGGIISGPLIPDQGPGMYRVTYRMRVDDNTKPEKVCTLYLASNGVLNSHTLGSRMILATDFRKAGEWEDFSLDFFRPPAGGMQYLCTWWGKVDLYLDSFTVTEVKRLSDRELLNFYGEAPGGAVAPDPAGGLFVLRGPFFPLYRLDDVAAALGTTVARVAHMATPGGNSTLNPPFPTDPSELSGFRAVVMADVDAEALGFYGRCALRKFVEAGGTLLVLGGWVSFGEGKLDGTFPEEMLPVTCSGPFDHVTCDPPCLLEPVAGWDTASKLPWDEKPCVLWMHTVTPKPGARVLVTAGRRPFLVAASFGNGRVVACAGTVIGMSPKGATPFWEWSGWPGLVSAALKDDAR